MRLLPLTLLCLCLALPACREQEESLDALRKRSDALIRQQIEALANQCRAVPGQHAIEVPLDMERPEKGINLYCVPQEVTKDALMQKHHPVILPEEEWHDGFCTDCRGELTSSG